MRTNNYSNILRQIYSLNDSALLDITNTAGQTADLPNNVVFKSDYTSVATDVANTTGFYVAIGSSNTEPTSNDTNLNSVLTSGFTSLITGPFYDFGTASVTSVLKITITAGDSDVTVGEFGWYYNGCLLDHTVLSSPVTIAANTMKTFGYAMFNGLYDQHKMATPAGVGRPGSLGFGVGIFRGNSKDLEEMQLTPMEGCEDVTSDNYGNYVHANGSVMCFIPAFCYRIGQPTAPSYERDGSNALEIGPADLDGTDNWILHRAFIDGGKKKSGFFIDKYINSKSSDGLTAVSVKNGNPISLTTDTSYNTSSTMTGGTGYLKDAITFGRNRGGQYSCITSFQWSAISMLQLAHAQASTSTEFCAWYDSANTTNFPKGNNNTKKDVNDSSIKFTASDATSTESHDYTKAGSGVPFAKTTHNGQNCGISDVNGNKYQLCIGYCSFSEGTNYVLKESIKAHDITTSNVSTTSNYDQATGYLSTGRYYWGANAFYTDSSGPDRAMCGVMPKTQTSTKLKIFGDDFCYFDCFSMFAAFVGGYYDGYDDAARSGVFCRTGERWTLSFNHVGCRCAGYPADSAYGIGKPGQAGFGVGVFKGDDKVLADMQLTPMNGYDDPTNDNYGNYQHANGSVMCFVPAFCYRIGKSTAPSYARDGNNALEIGPAELDGTDNWILHRAFIDGGQKKSGFFIDKYINSKSSDGLTAVSVKNGNPISLTADTKYNISSSMTGGTGYLKDAITFGRNRGDQYSCITSFQWSAISMLSLAHAQASTSTEFCAWYDSANNTNFPKGNNNTLKDINDSSITFTASDTTSKESESFTKAGSGVPFAKTTHNGQNCGISDVNGNKYQVCIGYASFTEGANYVLKESIKAHDITTSNVATTSNYDQATGYSSTGGYYWGADAFYTDSSGPNRALCGVMAKTQTETGLKIFGDNYCNFNCYSAFAALVGGGYYQGSRAGVFYRYGYFWSSSFDDSGCRCAGYPDETPNVGVGIPGTRGFGVGVYPGTSDELSAAGLTPMEGYNDPTSDNYGNYIHTNGSVMCFVPAFCYRIGQPTAPSYERDGSNALEIGPAELDGTDNWILHRAFIDGGRKKSGFFIDKYINSKSSDGLTAVSVKNGNPISLTTDSNYNRSSTMTGGTGRAKDAITFGRNRGEQYSCITSFQWSAISMLQLAHAQASTSTEFCAQYDSANNTNFPKGNNKRKTDIDDTSITFTASDVSNESGSQTKAGSGVPFAKTTHNGQNCGISDVNGNKIQPCIGYASFTAGTNYVLKESIKAHDITVDNILTKSNYDQASGYSGTDAYYWGADAFYTESSGPNRAMCGVMVKTQTSTKLKIFGDDQCNFQNYSDFAAMVGGSHGSQSKAGIFSRSCDQQSANDFTGCRCSGYLK